MAMPGGYDEDLDPMCDVPIGDDDAEHYCPDCFNPCDCWTVTCTHCTPDDDAPELWEQL